jgi:hybrid cluster-associated redox disulfide protein
MSNAAPRREPSAPFTKDMTVDQVMKHHPVARWVLFSYNLSGCGTCDLSENETLEQLSAKYGIPLPMILDDLNGILES